MSDTTESVIKESDVSGNPVEDKYMRNGKPLKSKQDRVKESITILKKLKELGTTAIGGRGTFPNGPDVLAINVYKVSGTATPVNIILRWGEAQA